MSTRKHIIVGFVMVIALVLSGLTTAGFSQDKYPVRPIQAICQWRAGSNVDLALRMLAEPIKEILGQPLVVVVKPGGQGIIGQNAMAKAKPDGYTIGLAALGPMVTVHLYTPKPPYKMTDFEPICGFYENPGGVGVRRDAPWETLDDFIADAKRNPMKYKIGLHVARGPVGMAIKKFILSSGIKVTIVPFAGGTKSRNAVLSGDVDACALHIGWVLRDPDRLKLLELFEKKRSPQLPDLPTAREKGRDLIMGARTGFVAPKGTPVDRIRILESALKKVITDPGFGKTLFKKLGMAPAFSSHEEIWEEWQDTYRRFSKIVVELRKAEKEFKELQKKK
ncbi:MAG: tripartite tricarboxylate transporter substrate binding protein [Thermoplasmata archaeon]|nr:MAG: tripartite tricarboxylate transporter substrate binding protein [Thermoplasmata archaeon]